MAALLGTIGETCIKKGAGFVRLKTREMILIALFAALTSIGAFIKIPTPIVPLTLQYLFCAYSGILLGSKLGLYSQLLYLVIGLMGFPVFTQGGGLTYIFSANFWLYSRVFFVCICHWKANRRIKEGLCCKSTSSNFSRHDSSLYLWSCSFIFDYELLSG